VRKVIAPKQQEALKLIARAAVAVERRHGLPADACAAQVILESAWLQSAAGFNCKGIKAHQQDIPDRAQLWRTREWFTDPQRMHFEKMGGGRKVIEATGQAKADGRKEYIVLDWFRKYDSLEECLEHWASMFLRIGRYSEAAKVYARTPATPFNGVASWK
jgi:flagellum-specific peptidoglycan hydrolase FlgJ